MTRGEKLLIRTDVAFAPGDAKQRRAAAHRRKHEAHQRRRQLRGDGEARFASQSCVITSKGLLRLFAWRRGGGTREECGVPRDGRRAGVGAPSART